MIKKILLIIALLLVSVSSYSQTITKGKVGKQDLGLWDGTSTKTHTRTSSTGYTLTLNSIDYGGVDICQVYGGGVNKTSTVLQAAITAVGVVNKVEFNMGTAVWTLTANVIVPANITLTFPLGSSINGAFTLAFSGSPDSQIKALPGQQIFGSTVTVTFAKKGIRYANWWGENTSPGTTDMTAAIQAAINSNDTGIVQLLGEKYAHTGLTVLTNGIYLKGEGLTATELYCTSGNAITLGDATTAIYDFRLEGMSVTNDSTSGHLIIIPYGLVYAYIDADFYQADIDKSIIYADLTGLGIYESKFTGMLWNITATATVPAVKLTSDANIISENVFFPKRVHANGADVHFFDITCTDGTTYNYHNIFRDITAEVVDGGFIKTAGAWGFSIQDISFWDITTTTDDLILLTNDGVAGLDTYNTSIINVQRHGGALGAGFYDINLDNADGTIMINIQGSTTPSVDANSRQAMLFNSPSITVANSTNVSRFEYSLVKAGLFSGPLSKLTLSDGGELTIADGVITPTKSLYTVDTEADGASDDLDTITAGTTGDILIFRPANDGRSVVLKHNTGNIIIEGAGDFTMDSSYDTAVLIYFGSKWLCIGKYNLGS